jgi:hypothetical protein
MSAQLPPDVIIFPGIDYNASFYNTTDTNGLSQTQADKRYLRFPNAQGDEILQGMTVNGISTFNNTAIMNSFASFKDNITPFTNRTTAYKSSDNFVLQGQDNNSGFVVINKDTSGNNITSLSTTATTLTVNPEATFNNTVRSNLFSNRSGSMSIGPTSNNTFNLVQGGITAANVRIAINSTDILVSNPLTTNSTTASNRAVKTSYLQLADIGSTNILNNDFQMFQSNPNTTFSNTSNGGAMVFAVRNSSGVTSTPINFNSEDLVLTTVNCPIANYSNAIPFTDRTSKLATTAWVGDALQTGYEFKYPQKWYSSQSSNSTNNITSSPQTVDIVFDIPANATGADINSIVVDVRIRYYIMGYINGTASGNYGTIFVGTYEGLLGVNIKDYTGSSPVNITNIVSQTNNQTTYSSPTGILNSTGNIISTTGGTSNVNLVVNGQTAGTAQIATPLRATYNTNGRNRITIAFGAISTNPASTQSGIMNIIRSIEIRSSSINSASTYNNTSQYYPSVNTTQLPAYLQQM